VCPPPVWIGRSITVRDLIGARFRDHRYAHSPDCVFNQHWAVSPCVAHYLLRTTNIGAGADLAGRAAKRTTAHQ
jgi:hypothetical protein